MNVLGEWALALLLSATCETPTAWVDVPTVSAVCGDEDGEPVLNARNPWALPWNLNATRKEFDQSNADALDRARKVR